MRNLTVLAIGVSALSLSGCSFLGGVFGHGNNHHQSYVPAPYQHGSYHTPRADDCCVGGKALSKWNLEGGVGPAFLTGGRAVTGSKLNAGNPNQIRNIDMADAYDNGTRVDLGTSYALTPNRKLTGQVFYQNHEGAGTQSWGTVADQELTGGLSDYNSYGVEVGLRQYFQPRIAGQSIGYRPYVEGKLGAANVDDITIQGSQLGGNTFSAADIPFYEGGWVPTAAGMVGIETPAFERMTLGLETGIRYMGKPASDGAALTPGGPISGANNGGDSWSIPLTLRGRYRF